MTLLSIGKMLDESETSVKLDARRFNRHTFWCGQSGSGKTYALGVVLEQLLLHTALPIVILDPNADFVRMRETRATASAEEAEKLASMDLRVFRSGNGKVNAYMPGTSICRRRRKQLFYNLTPSLMLKNITCCCTPKDSSQHLTRHRC